MIDKRAWSRFNVDVAAWIDLPNGQTLEARCSDLSSHGLKLRTTQALDIDSHAVVHVQATQEGVVDFEVDIQVQRVALAGSQFEIGAHVLDIR